MKLMSYRNLGEPGGPFYDPAYPNPNDNPFVKALAAENEILSPTPNDIGEFDYRPATPADTFRSPYPNVEAARAANGGAAPPDLSVITKARHGGASYVYHLLSGYPHDDAFVQREVDGETVTYVDMSKMGGHGDEHAEGLLKVNPGQYYNPYMAGDTTPNFEGDPRHAPKGGFLAMPPQLLEGRVEYTDGTEATVQQMAYDVAQFLAWAGEPKQEHRKKLGLAVMAYLLILAVLLWFSYKQIWRKIDH
jgi:ubiquinol-cytochrome c reductase cytochrome c1 subunit